MIEDKKESLRNFPGRWSTAKESGKSFLYGNKGRDGNKGVWKMKQGEECLNVKMHPFRNQGSLLKKAVFSVGFSYRGTF